MQGGVCKKIGTACCTYIPANDAENGTLSEAIQTLHTLQTKMIDEGGAPDSWFSGWFVSLPSWMSGLLGAFVTHNCDLNTNILYDTSNFGMC